MINFRIDTCPRCGKKRRLMFNNNPLCGSAICFECLNKEIDPQNLEHAEFFCRTYNLPWKPDLWIELVQEYNEQVFEQYTSLVIEDEKNKPNLYYAASTKDLWSRTNKEWEKCRSFTEILNKLKPIRDSFCDRGHLKWGEQYTFEELLRLDSIYSRTLKANNMTNPLQKEAVKTLCKLQIQMDDAIRSGDAKAIRDYSSSWSNFAKQADLEGMINETKTDDITTVAELYQYMEDKGYQFKYYDGYDRDEVDKTIKDLTDTNRKLILECTGLQTQLEDMMKQRMETKEEEHTKEIVESTTIQDLINFTPEDQDIETENDDEALELEFDDEDSAVPKTTVIKGGE